jgi:hypothetical protein
MHTVVGGPPNSGKSTITAALVKLCRERKRGRGYNPTFGWSTLDITDTSLPAMLGSLDEYSRDAGWTMERAEERKLSFAARDEQLVLADCPGKIDDKTRTVVEPANAMVLVVSDQRQDDADKWREFAAENDLELRYDLTTTLDKQKEPRWTDRDAGKAIIRSVHNDEFESDETTAYDDTTRRILKTIAKELLSASERQ